MKYILGVLLLVSLCFGFTWLLTCGFIKLITLCFGLNFSWAVATGIWLTLLLLSAYLKNSGNNK